MLIGFVFSILFLIFLCCKNLQIIMHMKTANVLTKKRNYVVNMMNNSGFLAYFSALFINLINLLKICPQWGCIYTLRTSFSNVSTKARPILFYICCILYFYSLFIFLFVCLSSGNDSWGLLFGFFFAFATIAMTIAHRYMTTLARSISEHRLSDSPSLLHRGVLFYFFFVSFFPFILVAMEFPLFFKLCYNIVSHVQFLCMLVRGIIARKRDSASLIIYKPLTL
jgi:hypothetical protein